MSMFRRALTYSVFFFMLFCIDYVTKAWALITAQRSVMISSWLELHAVLNKGISWGIFHTADSSVHQILSIGISLIIVMLALYTVARFLQGAVIWPEVLILAGACGNLVDRFVYSGVVDFIVFRIGFFDFPVCNCADIYIVVGGCIALLLLRDA